MGKSGALFGASLSLLLFAAAPGKAQESGAVADGGSETAVRSVEYVFEVTAGNRTSRLVIREETRGGERIYVSKTDDLEQFYRYGSGGRLIEWRFSNPGKNTAFVARMEGSAVAVTGALKGQPVDKTIEAGGEPWFQNSEFALVSFARSDGKTFDFFAVDPDGLKRVSFRARKLSGETVQWRGRAVDTLRIRAHLPGPLSVVWSATYWYALPDFTFIRYQASGGGGAPKTDIRLLETVVR